MFPLGKLRKELSPAASFTALVNLCLFCSNTIIHSPGLNSQLKFNLFNWASSVWGPSVLHKTVLWKLMILTSKSELRFGAQTGNIYRIIQKVISQLGALYLFTMGYLILLCLEIFVKEAKKMFFQRPLLLFSNFLRWLV